MRSTHNNQGSRSSICYINPTVIVRRPLAELMEIMSKDRDVGVLIPKKLFQGIDKTYHGSNILKKGKVYTYSTISLPGMFEWPIPVTPMFFIQLFRIFKQYDIIHMWTYSYLVNLWAALFSFFSRSQLIMTTDTFPGYSFNMGSLLNIAYKIHNWTFGRLIFLASDKITVYGKSLLPFARKMSLPMEKIRVIPTGIHLNRFTNAKKKDIHKELRIPKKMKIVLSIGLVTPRKGVDIALKVAQQLPDVMFLWVGRGPGRKTFEKMMKKSNITNFKFIGVRKDVDTLLASSDLFFLPSRAEGLPGVVMEAMASGKPVVSTHIPCVHDLIDKKQCVLVQPEHVTGYARAVKQLLQPAHARKQTAYNKKKIKAFSWEKISAHYKALYGGI